MLTQELGLGLNWLFLLVPAIAAMTAGLLLQWNKKWQAWAAIAVLLLTGALCALFYKRLSSGVAGLLEKVSYWWFLRTGTYTPGFEHAGNVTPVLFLTAVLSGFWTAWLLRMKKPLFQCLLTLAVLFAWMAGLLTHGWWLAVYLLGTLLTIAAYASGWGKPLTFSGAVALILAVAVTGTVLLSGVAPEKSKLGSRLSKELHQLRWEQAENPMPEGVLTDLGVYRPTDEASLEVTMEQWTPLYLRGFVAGAYTDDGWLSADSTDFANKLYALQEEHFFASDQIFAAWQSLDIQSDNTVQVRIAGACRSNAYLPYGAGAVTGHVLSSGDLRWEGMHGPDDTKYTAKAYAVEDSYLLQAQLSDGGNTSYRSAESVYRDQVYAQYLDVPEDVSSVLTRHFSLEEGITTVQAKRQIAQLLDQHLTYNENVLTVTGERDFLSYVLEVSRSGYSVHYATLATLMLRVCGIPARYVEGYVVSPSQAAALADGESLTLTQRNAHAWTEYYLDGVGWLPFDATPGYSDILVYALPTEGRPTQESMGEQQPQQEQPDPQKEQPPVKEEQTRQRQRVYVREAISLALLMVLLAITLLILRTVLLRRRLRKQQQVFYGCDHRKACAGILCYMLYLAKTMESTDGNLTVSALSEQTAEALDHKVSATELKALINEVWYSGHAITRQQQEMALSWLKEASSVWKQKVPALKRFKQRFITCNVM